MKFSQDFVYEHLPNIIQNCVRCGYQHRREPHGRQFNPHVYKKLLEQVFSLILKKNIGFDIK